MADEDKKTAPKAEAWKDQDAADDREIAKLLGQSQGPDTTASFNFNDDTPFDQTNKADDAEDFEDISDDDLPDEEPSAGTSLELPGLTDDGGTSNDADADDLFGEGPSSPMDQLANASSPATRVHDTEAGDDATQADVAMSYASINFDPEPHLNGDANQDPNIPQAVENKEELLKAAWPAYKPGEILVWSELLPPKRATWKEKKPGRKPKHLVTGKLTLELAPDQEKQFRIPGPATGGVKSRFLESQARGLVLCDDGTESKAQQASQFDLDQESDSETVMGFTLRDIEMVCDDWAAHIDTVESEFVRNQQAEEQSARKRGVEEQDEEWDAEFLMDMDDLPKKKKRKAIKSGLPEISRYIAPSFDNFEEATKRGAKRVHLDIDDPYLLLETQDNQQSKRLRHGPQAGQTANGKMRRDMAARFNLSNDEAYEMLKENHQSKVRATLGNISVEHSMPAVKLTWPYYQVKLRGTTDEYHRPRFRTKKFAGYTIRFDKPHHAKRKLMKGKAQEVFRSSKDLSITDNGTAVLFEYCEPRPRVLNGFGMGNKLINYYRRKDANDEEQLDKRELGEYRTLLPEDRSPFSLFGTVDSGEVVPTLHNEMYRAPVFRHTPRHTDFLMVRNTTGVEGSKWYLHKIDHLHVVGQTFPSVEVPGPHSRKVTNASKNRMKMLAFRMIRHSATDNAQLSDITKHIADSTDTQNRQKLKEFLRYDKASQDRGMWRLRDGETLPDESAVRAMIKPEDVCLLDAMQLGMKELEDAGYDPRNANIDEDAVQKEDADGEDEDMDDDGGSKVVKGTKKPGEKQEETLADKMAPWKTTKAFIDACAQKAMLQLHGEGDPTGHGLGFSFIRTSMKGGYIEAVQGPLATSADAMEREKRANGGHAYNVKKQQAMYEEGIREIWEKQKATLSDPQILDEDDIAGDEDEDDRFNVQSHATPAQFDDGTSQISGLTSSSRHPKRAIRISREITMADGSKQTRIEVVHDPVVISQYMKRRTEADLEMRDLYSSVPTGNADHDRLTNLRIKKELERLEKNKARRQAREQQKELQNRASNGDAGSPAPGAPGDKIPGGTTRKCANCGQVGHIKTNKNKRPKSSKKLELDFIETMRKCNKRQREEKVQNEKRNKAEAREQVKRRRIEKADEEAREKAAIRAAKLQQQTAARLKREQEKRDRDAEKEQLRLERVAKQTEEKRQAQEKRARQVAERQEKARREEVEKQQRKEQREKEARKKKRQAEKDARRLRKRREREQRRKARKAAANPYGPVRH